MAKHKKQNISVKTDRPPDSPGATKPLWKFFRHSLAEWKNWYENDIADDAEAKHDNVFETLENQPIWRGFGFYEPIGGGMAEIKIKSKKQWRLLGYSGPGKGEFTITMICEHKDDNYLPKDAFKTARERKEEIESGRAQRLPADRPGKEAEEAL